MLKLIFRHCLPALAHGTFQGLMSGIQGGGFYAGFAAGALSSIAGSYMNKLGGIEVTNATGGCSTFGAKNANLMVGLTLTSGAIMGGVGANLAGGSALAESNSINGQFSLVLANPPFKGALD